MGAWIEIPICFSFACIDTVAPLVGAWIEIMYVLYFNLFILVAPLVGAWIEIRISDCINPDDGSLPLWERGLKC